MGSLRQLQPCTVQLRLRLMARQTAESQLTQHPTMCTFRMSTRESGPMPLYTTPIFGVKSEIFCTVLSSTRIDGTCSGKA